MDELRYANIALDIFSIILSVLPIVYLVSNHQYRQKLNLYFLGVCISNIFMIGGDLPDWLMPVSYTHLDVYKRQLQPFLQLVRLGIGFEVYGVTGIFLIR